MIFEDLKDGEYFTLNFFHSNRVFQKVMEDGEHNAVWAEHPHIGERFPNRMVVTVVDKPTK